MLSDNWSWHMKNGMAFLQEEFTCFKPIPYSEGAAKTALENVKIYKKDYVVKGAWLQELKKFEQGVALFADKKNKK